MNFHISSDGQTSQGPFSLEELSHKQLRPNTLIWREGMANWQPASQFPELQEILAKTPPAIGHGNNQDPFANTPPPPQPSHFQQNQHRLAPNPEVAYSLGTYVNDISPEERARLSHHTFGNHFSVGLAIFLHYITFGIFTFIHYGLLYDGLPKVKSDDFGAGKAIGFMFIPFFNLYWTFMFWPRLPQQINFQYKLRNQTGPLSEGLALTRSILQFVPYLGFFANFFVITPILLAQTQSAVNGLVKQGKNTPQGQPFYG